MEGRHNAANHVEESLKAGQTKQMYPLEVSAFCFSGVTMEWEATTKISWLTAVRKSMICYVFDRHTIKLNPQFVEGDKNTQGQEYVMERTSICTRTVLLYCYWVHFSSNHPPRREDMKMWIQIIAPIGSENVNNYLFFTNFITIPVKTQKRSPQKSRFGPYRRGPNIPFWSLFQKMIVKLSVVKMSSIGQFLGAGSFSGSFSFLAWSLGSRSWFSGSPSIVTCHDSCFYIHA